MTKKIEQLRKLKAQHNQKKRELESAPGHLLCRKHKKSQIWTAEKTKERSIEERDPSRMVWTVFSRQRENFIKQSIKLASCIFTQPGNSYMKNTRGGRQDATDQFIVVFSLAYLLRLEPLRKKM